MTKNFLHSLQQSLFPNASNARKPKRRRSHRRSLAMESLESRQMLSITPLQALSTAENTGEKPQSKVFEYASQWWTVMPNSSGTWVFRLDGNSWTPTQQITTKDSVHADVKLVGDLAHVLLYDDSSSQLATLQYDAGPDNRFEPWSLRPQLVNLGLPSGTETATLDIDSTGRMWIAYDPGSRIDVRYSDGLYTNWSAPITVESGIKSDDLAAIIAMPGNQIGVMWSNQNTKRFGFKVHQDGTAPNAWSSLETPALQWVTSVGGAIADDHLNLAVTSDGTLYAAVKTGYDSSSRPEIALLVRRPNGVWDNLYQVDTKGTRPIVVVNEAAGKLIVAYSPSDSGGDTVYKESPLGTISFSARKTLISGSNNNVTSTKYTSSNEIVFLAGSSSTARGVRFSFDTGVTQVVNLPPVVNAGPDRSTVLGTAVSLDGTVSDDGQPTPASLATSWTKVSGPGTVTFGNASNIDTTANFSLVGTYVLRLTANDGQYSRFDDVTVTVSAVPVANLPPSVNSGNDRSGVAGTPVALDGTVSDDGQPTPASLTTTWSKTSGPGTVTFGNLNAVDTTATFSAAGTYVLRLTANDGQLTTFDEITFTVSPASQTPDPTPTAEPTQIAFQDGLFPYVSYAGTTDTKIASGKATTNYGTATTFDVDGDPDIAALLRWDVSAIPTGSIIVSAAIDLYVTNSTKQNYEVYALQRAWDELSATWQRFVSNSSWSGAGATGSADHGSAVLGQLGPGGTGIQRITLNAAGIAAVQAWINDPNSNFGIILQDYAASDGMDFYSSEYSTAARRPKLVINYETPAPVGGGAQGLTSQEEPTDPPVVNLPPVVNAGIDRSTQLGTPVSLDGTVTDDGQPTSASIATVWTKFSGPGTVTFGNSTAVDTTASFTVAGTYVLRLTASDGEYSIGDDVTITVSDPPAPPASNPNPPAPSGTPTEIAFQDGLFPYVSYAGTTDTKITSGKANTNYGAATSFDVDTNIGALLRWDVSAIPTNSIIVSAAIELHVTNTTKQNFEVYALQRAWDELSATWQQYAAGNPWAGAGATGGSDYDSTVLGQLGSGSNGVHRIELNEAGVAAVQAWISDPEFNFGIILQDYAASDGVDFYSSEYSTAARRPKLVINYDTPAT
jgi:hypothetical protein